MTKRLLVIAFAVPTLAVAVYRYAAAQQRDETTKMRREAPDTQPGLTATPLHWDLTQDKPIELFTVGGCTVYRFVDGEHVHYLARSGMGAQCTLDRY
jgi:hypothetical protein